MNFGKWIGLFIFIICLYIIWQIRQLLLLLFTAIILAVCFNIVLEKLQEFNLKRGQAILLSLLIFLVSLVGIFFLLIPPFITQFRELSRLVPQGIDSFILDYNNFTNRLDPTLAQIWPKPRQILAQIQPIVNQIAGTGWTFFYSSLGRLLGFLLIFALTMMLVVNPQGYRRGFIRFFPAFYRSKVDHTLTLCEEGLREWLIRILTHMTLMTVLSLGGLVLLGIPLSLAQALLAGLFTFIAYLGPLLGMIPPLALALLQESWKPLGVLLLFWAIYLTIQRFDKNPPLSVFRARFIPLLPALTILGQICCAKLFGFTGLFLAVPLLIVGYIWFREVIIRDILDRWLHHENYPRD
jgi:predicted PurR-regulated permease PerM